MRAINIAYWFLLKANAEMKEYENDDYVSIEPMTHLKVQKLIYYAQGIYMSMTGGKLLFEENIIAWQHGPVVEEVYQVFKEYGREPIHVELTEEICESIELLERDIDIHEALELTYDNFAGYTALQLRHMTHEKGTPWDMTPINMVIDNHIIQDYFIREIME